MAALTCGAERKNRSAGTSPDNPWCGLWKLYASTYKESRLWKSSKSAKTVRDKNSSHNVFQNRSILPSVCGCCGRLFTCLIPSRRSSSSNSVDPRQLVYCRPWSVSTSLGAPNAATPRDKASITSTDLW